MELEGLAEKFIVIATDYSTPWKRRSRIVAAEEVRTLLDLVRAAGFEATGLTTTTKVHYFSTTPVRTGVLARERAVFDYVVQDQEGDNLPATCWLDSLSRRGLQCLAANMNYNVLKREMTIEIRRSWPLPPIQLTSEGDTLVETSPGPNGVDYLVDHTRDSDLLDRNSYVGVHEFCGGRVDRTRATAAKDALVCRSCFVRVLFPSEIRTYGELRRYLEKTFVLAT